MSCFCNVVVMFVSFNINSELFVFYSGVSIFNLIFITFIILEAHIFFLPWAYYIFGRGSANQTQFFFSLNHSIHKKVAYIRMRV